MMKAYVKPELFYERYELSQYIASCAARWNFEPQACDMTIVGGLTIFAAESSCALVNVEEEYCYMNSTVQGLPTFVS